MDGWETRRRRSPGHDACIIRLGLPGLIKGLDIDTRHFTGNYPKAASLDACYGGLTPDIDTAWTPLLLAMSLNGDAHHYLEIRDERVWTHVRLNIILTAVVVRHAGAWHATLRLDAARLDLALRSAGPGTWRAGPGLQRPTLWRSQQFVVAGAGLNDGRWLGNPAAARTGS